MVVCLERGADLHMAQLMPLPFTICCFSKIQISFTGKRAIKRVCVCACVRAFVRVWYIVQKTFESLNRGKKCKW